MRALCPNCNGHKFIFVERLSLRGTVNIQETCKVCRGKGSYDMLKGPGVDHTKTHGTGLAKS